RTRGGHTFAPEAGAPTIRGGGRFICRSTALGANRSGTHSHPRRVLLRHEAVAGSFVGAPPPVRTGQARTRTRGGCSYDTGWWEACRRSTASVRTGQARIRTRRGCSYDTGWWEACRRSTAPGANRSSTYSHPGRVLLRYGVVGGLS